MGNVATKERPRSNSVSYMVYQEQQQQQLSNSNRPRTRSVPDPLANTASLSRQHRKSKKKREEPQPPFRLTFNPLETVDGGYLQPHGVYSGAHDFDYPIVRKLILDRRLAPFYKGLQDYKKTWTDAELLEAIKSSPLPASDSTPTDIALRNSLNDKKSSQLASGSSIKSNSSSSDNVSANTIKPTSSDYVISDAELIALYRDVIECPICFLFYSNRLNLTRCCEQPICTECFVQIQRKPPHYPEEDEDEEVSGTLDEQEARNQLKQMEKELISVPACCPFCLTPEMGITYTPPRVRTGLASAKGKLLSIVNESTLSSDSIAIADDDKISGEENMLMSSSLDTPSPLLERRGSLAATNPEVVTTDQIRPEWALRLAAARAYTARKSATASAIHASAFNPQALANRDDSRSGSSSSGTSASAGASRRATRSMVVDVNPRLQELEEMMLMEAIRLSMLEEERRTTNSVTTAGTSSAATNNTRSAGRIHNE